MMSSQQKNLSIHEVKRYLEGAGFDTEEDMPEDYMRNCYDAIKSSEKSFGTERSNGDSSEEDLPVKSSQPEEDKAPDVADTPDPVFKPKMWTTRRKATQTPIDEILIESDESEVKSDKNDKQPSVKKTYKQIRSEFNNMDPFDCAPFEQQVKIIEHQPRHGVPIYCDPKYSKLSYKQRFALIYNMHKEYECHLQRVQSLSKDYAPWPAPIKTSENFNESPKSDLVASQQSNEDEEVYMSKKGRKVKRKLYSEMMDDDDDVTKSNSSEGPRKKKAVTAKDDLMKKSRLFGDGAKQSSRGKKIFEKVAEEDRERRLKEEEMNKFTLSIAESVISDSDEEIESTAKTEAVKNSPIVAPLQSRRPFKRQLPTLKSLIEPDSKEIADRVSQFDETCPICSKSFKCEDLIQHASFCGELEEEENVMPRRSANASNALMCGCYKVFSSQAEYESHRKICPHRSISE